MYVRCMCCAYDSCDMCVVYVYCACVVQDSVICVLWGVGVICDMWCGGVGKCEN